MKAVFKSNDNCTYTLNMDDTMTQVGGRQANNLTTLFPSTSNSESVKDAVFLYNDYLVKDGKEIDICQLIEFNWYSIVRVYKDIFLTYDDNTESWVLVRVVVP